MEDVLKHRLESQANYPDSDFPPPLVVQARSLSPKTLQQLPSYLLSLVETRYETEGGTLFYTRPIVFELEDAGWLSERVLWSVLVDALPNTAEWIIDYVDAHIECDGDELQFTTYVEVVGEPALYAYFDSFVNTEPRLSTYHKNENIKTQNLEVIDCFIRFLKHCDLDHEVYQHDYIKRVLDYLDLLDEYARYLDLLTLRLSSGHYQLYFDNFTDIGHYLHRVNPPEGAGLLKALVDHWLDKEGRYGLGDIMKLSTLLYGSETHLIRDVISYCRDRLGPDVIDEPSYEDPALSRYRILRDLELHEIYKQLEEPPRLNSVKLRPIRTGFHTFSPETGQWTRVLR